MRGAHNATTSPTTVIAAGVGWTYVYLHNNSDTTIYVQWTDEANALTTSNGVPIAAGSALRLAASAQPSRPAVRVIHGGSGNKELRYVAE